MTSETRIFALPLPSQASRVHTNVPTKKRPAEENKYTQSPLRILFTHNNVRRGLLSIITGTAANIEWSLIHLIEHNI